MSALYGDCESTYFMLQEKYSSVCTDTWLQLAPPGSIWLLLGPIGSSWFLLAPPVLLFPLQVSFSVIISQLLHPTILDRSLAEKIQS